MSLYFLNHKLYESELDSDRAAEVKDWWIETLFDPSESYR